ncbi:hypothetical protein [Oligoflexus tunisiensis]|uniref:hypothetical protein n=1 Tax=Oligoflexus tunisiensis TaxID=708132 RepID=UPI00114D15AE|nr:hypothetical protein [Oligoflexus tunisiensis]
MEFAQALRLWMAIALLLSSALRPTLAADKKPARVLPFDQLKHYQVALEKGLYAVYREKDMVLTSSRTAKFYLKSQYNETAKEQDLGFGSLHVPTDKSERVPFPENESEKRIRGILPLGPHWFFLDAERRQFALWHHDRKIWLRPADIILDLAKPPRDPRGEPTRSEVAELRRGFTRAFSRVQQDNNELFGGLAPIPSFWKDRDGSQFLMLLRVPGTPLMTVRCQGRNMDKCQAMRACFIHGLPSHLVEELYGLAVDPVRKELLIGNPGERRIMRFKAPSCYHIAHLRTRDDIGLPEQLKDLSSLFIDADRNLWLTTLRPDLYKSASLFRFDASVWAPEPTPAK